MPEKLQEIGEVWGQSSERGDACSQRVSTGADTKANTRGGGALEMGDLRLLEDGCERGGALVSDIIVPETARDG